MLTERTEKSLATRYGLFFLLTGILVVAFCIPLYNLVRYALEPVALFSHILLIPFISSYFIWQQRATFPEPSPRLTFLPVVLGLCGAILLAIWFVLRSNGTVLSKEDSLFFSTGAFLSFFLAVTIFSLGPKFCRQIAFPLGFLIWVVPFPDVMTNTLETISKHASAETYAVLMKVTRTPHFREGLVFAMPGLTIEVAQECSGIRSSLVLFITSLIAGYVFLSRPRNRALLAFAVIPLGILRNAFRILVLSLLTIHWDPRVIDSPLHHRGGPLFFALSLVPFLLLLVWFSKSERLAVKP